MLAISQDEDTPLEIQVKINLDLMNYVYPKRKSVEFNDKIDVSISEKSVDEYNLTDKFESGNIGII